MTTSFDTRLADAASFATCKLLSDAGSAATTFAVFNAYNPKVAAVSAAAGWVANFASRMGCQWNPNGQSILPPGQTYVEPGSCMETEGCDLLLRDVNGAQFGPGRCKKLFDVGYAPPAPNGTPLFTYSYVNCDDETVINTSEASRLPLRTELEPGAVCKGDPQGPPPPTIPTYEYTDQSTGCTLIIETLGFSESSPGVIDPVFRFTPGTELRGNGGGIIGGCNFSPTIYYQPGPGGGDDGGDGEGPPRLPPIPDPGPPEEPEGPPYWLDLLYRALAGAAGAAVANALADYFEWPYAGTTYRLISACEVDDSGEPISEAVEVPIPSLKNLDAVLARVDALTELMQGLKDFRQPICYVKPADGDARTISFVSETKSPNGNDYLRKRFSYRSKSGKDLGGVIDHWSNFQFDAGSVVVGHVGSSLGTLKVWAASVDEGKRVIQHAAAEAGVNPDQNGQWTTGSSDSSRCGVSGRMRVNTKGGYWWITDRKGAERRPIVGYEPLSDT